MTNSKDHHALATSDTELMRTHFDKLFYLSRYPDVAAAGIDPFQHFIEKGWREGRWPNRAFSIELYANAKSSELTQNDNPFLHFLRSRTKLGKNVVVDDIPFVDSVKAAFDSDFYLRTNRDVADDGVDPFDHYAERGWTEGRDPSPSFSNDGYMRAYHDVSSSGLIPLTHYVLIGEAEGRVAATGDNSDKALMAKHFDAEFYLDQNPDIRRANIDPFEHFIHHGWKEGRDPNVTFSIVRYNRLNRLVIPEGVNPFAHYLSCLHQYAASGKNGIDKISSEFDRLFYLKCNSDVARSLKDPFEHYMTTGWRESRDPTPYFSTAFYRAAYPDIAASGLNPFQHYVEIGRAEGRLPKARRPHVEIASGIDAFSESDIAARYQDMTFPQAIEGATKLLVIVVPEHNEMSGGIYSMFSIARELRASRQRHGFQVVVMTNPNSKGETYAHQSNFVNSERVFRIEQLQYCLAVKELYIHIPEYATSGFLDRCSDDLIRFLVGREQVYVNILNQNTRLMPDRHEFAALRRISDGLTQSVAHHAYFGQEFADKYDLPTLLLPAYTDLSSYPSLPLEEKESLIIYSPDSSPWRKACLNLIERDLPDYKLVEIRGMTFEYFMELAARCRFSLSFGEGFDGYVAQPIHQGGLGLTLFNSDFFPSDKFKNFPNFFNDEADLLANITKLIRRLEKAPEEYKRLNRSIVQEYDQLYSLADYRERISRLVARQFEVFPRKRNH